MDATRAGGSTNWSDTLARLSSKAGVKSALVMDRSLKTVLMAKGSFSSFHNPNPATTSVSSTATQDDDDNRKEQGAEELAMMVWNYVNATDGFVHNLDSEDDLKLLRIRTKKNELVIVPDAKYIFVVVHETSPA